MPNGKWQTRPDHPTPRLARLARVTLFDIDPSRGHEVILRMLGDDFGGVLSSDGFCAYDVPAYVKLRCNGHVLRRISGLKETLQDPLDLFWLEKIDGLFRESADLRARHRVLTPRGYGRRVREIENRFDHWLSLNTQYGHKDLGRLARHLADHRHEWFLYLYNPELPTTNNLAEAATKPHEAPSPPRPSPACWPPAANKVAATAP